MIKTLGDDSPYDLFCFRLIPHGRIMKGFYFCASFFSFVIIHYAAVPEKSDCLEKEKALALLETAEDFLSKAEDSYPSCKQELNSTDQSECDGRKPLAYIEISKKLIFDVRGNFPTCRKFIVEYDEPTDCSEIFESGRKDNGVYMIRPRVPYSTKKPSLQVYCDMKTDNGGWTVIQRRGKFPVQQDFYQDWKNYKNGFGNITEEFWLGNENIRILCHKGCQIRFDLQDKDSKKAFALYKNFKLLESNYTLQISGHTGDAGDSMMHHNNFVFSTKDKGYISRAIERQGGWWCNDNTYSNLNGIYQPGKEGFEGIVWYTWRNKQSLASVEIKVRPN